MHNILTPLFAYGPPRAAPAHFPYDHPTLAQVDLAEDREKAHAEFKAECAEMRAMLKDID